MPISAPETRRQSSALAAALPAANPAVMLAALVSQTGELDRARGIAAELSHAFAKGGIVASLPEQPAAELKAWAERELAVREDVESGDAAVRRPELSDEVFAEVASWLVGWPVPVASSAFYKEQAGFTDFVESTAHPEADVSGVSLLVIGAGMGGIAAAVAAAKAGISCTVVEKADQLGGVWQRNTYPGVGVDTPSAYYSFSFEVNDEWSGIYPKGQEYLDYLNRVADQYDVRKDIRLGTTVTGMAWDDAAKVWEVRCERGGRAETIRANYVMTAAGYLTRPQVPQVPGLDAFAGTWFHSADWDHDYDFAGKRLAVVGTGCTSVQVVDALVDEVASLTLVQRQPHWVMPAAVDDEFAPEEVWLSTNVGHYALWNRLLTFLPISDTNYPVVRYDAEWAAEHDLSISAANDAVLQVAQGYLEESFADRPDLLERLRPNFAPFGKRTIRDPGNYYSALKRDTSTVASGLSELVPEGLVDADGKLHEVDVIVFATGFSLEYLADIEIAGRDGVLLSDVWAQSPSAYNGCQVPGFPNLFITSGPHASAAHGGGHNFTIEAVVHYLIESIRATAARGAASLEATPEAWQRWQQEVREQMADTIWAREKRATTYYRNSAGEVILASPLLMEDFWARLRGPVDDDMIFGG
ncbi:NAD(P)/FAD-dependent oxidoreductase [Nocardioides dubius]|uniref:NAD(P)/FAD-dependent oxidoreductase n=1 Tax=Nocardioides dubius TaxID=317019 RepID=A0ABN2NYV8_9ACTN